MKKECSICKQVKETSEFRNHVKTSDGLMNRCRACIKPGKEGKYPDKRSYDKARREWKKANGFTEFENERQVKGYHRRKEQNPEKYQEYLKAKREYRTRQKERYMFLAARKRAKLANLPFNIKVSDIIIPKYCPILNIEIIVEENNKNLNGPSLDKIIPELGYVKGNICVISRKANMMKLNSTLEELELFSKNIIKYINDYKEKK